MLPPGLTDAKLEEMYHVAVEASPRGLVMLEQMVKRYPIVPSLWNYLAVGYRGAGKEKKAREVERRMLEQHPDYLFSKVAEAGHRLDAGRGDSLPEILGQSMTLREALGHDRPPHVSEWKHFYAILFRWHLEADRLEHAEKLLEAIQGESHTDDVSAVLQKQMWLAQIKAFQKRSEADRKMRIEVDQGEVPKIKQRLPRPAALSPEVEVLYRYGFDMPQSAVDAILNLPRGQAVTELRLVLRDAIENGPYHHHFRDRYREEELCFGLHALWLLGEMKAKEALPDVLDFMSQHSEILPQVFGLSISWEPLVGFIDENLDPLVAWMKAPGLPTGGRSRLSEAVAVAAEHRPELRRPAVDFLREVFEAMLQARPGDGMLDTPLISQMLGDVIALRAVELEDLVRKLYAKKLVEIGFAGSLEMVLDEMRVPATPPRPIPGIIEYYRRLIASEWDLPGFKEFEEFFEASGIFDEMPGGIAEGLADREPGRNDPCPCGSGKKYKKCCMK